MIKTRKEVGRKLEKRADSRFLGAERRWEACVRPVTALSQPPGKSKESISLLPQ